MMDKPFMSMSGNVGQPPGLGHEDAKPEVLEPPQVSRRIATLPAEDQIGFDRKHTFHVDSRGVANAGQTLCLRWVVAVAHDCGHLRACTRRERDFGEVRRQDHNPARPRAPLDQHTAIVAKFVRVCGHGDERRGKDGTASSSRQRIDSTGQAS